MTRKRRFAYIVMAAGLALGLQGPLDPARSCGGGSGMGGRSSCSQQANDPSDPPGTTGLHGGYFTVTKANAFETGFSLEGIRLYRFTTQGHPRLIDEAEGQIEIQFPDGTKQDVELHRGVPAEGDEAVWFCPMHLSIVRQTPGACPKCGMDLLAQDFLFAPIDLSPYLARELGWKVSLKGLGEPEKKAKFTQRGLPSAEAITSPAVENEPGHVH